MRGALAQLVPGTARAGAVDAELFLPLIAFLGLAADDWSALGQMTLAFGGIAAGLWAIHNYRRARSTEAARWLQSLFSDFYLSDHFTEVRLLLEYNYPERAGPLLERRITDPDVPLSVDEIDVLRGLDTLLNYFEHLLYLEGKKSFKKDDRLSLFDYWFEIMLAPERASLRMYADRFGFERVAAVLHEGQAEYRPRQSQYIAVYGTLMRGFSLPDAPEDLDRYVTDRGPCVISGKLYDLGHYPGLRIDPESRVHGRLYEVIDPKAFRLLDEYERYDPHHPETSLYIRRAVRLADPKRDVWVYVYNGEVGDRPVIDHGDWGQYLSARERMKARADEHRRRTSPDWRHGVRAKLGLARSAGRT